MRDFMFDIFWIDIFLNFLFIYPKLIIVSAKLLWCGKQNVVSRAGPRQQEGDENDDEGDGDRQQEKEGDQERER